MHRWLLLPVWLLCIVVLTAGPSGCKKDTPAAKDQAAKDKSSDKEKKNGDDKTMLFGEPGEKYHVKLTADPAAKKVEARILDESATVPAPIDADVITLVFKDAKPKPLQIKLQAQRAKDAKKTDTFTGQDDRFAEKIDHDHVEINAMIDGKSYTFKAEDHEHHKKK